MNTDLPPRSRQVAQVLAEAGISGQVRQLADSTRTAADAAAALNCDIGAIANSLVFRAHGQADGVEDEPLLVLTSGRHRVDTTALAATLGYARCTRADAAEVRAATGQAIGGVAPVGHPSPLRTVVDIALADYAVVWAAAGTPRTVFPTTHDELVRLTGGVSLPVGEG